MQKYALITTIDWIITAKKVKIKKMQIKICRKYAKKYV
mgnify:CR=1 FL=1